MRKWVHQNTRGNGVCKKPSALLKGDCWATLLEARRAFSELPAITQQQSRQINRVKYGSSPVSVEVRSWSGFLRLRSAQC